MMTYAMQEADLLSDEQLVGLTLAGDREAFGQIVTRYQAAICALAYSACGSLNRSEDLAQEVFVAAWRSLRELKEPAKLKSWLYGIARNRIFSAFRQQTRNPLASAEPLEEVLENSAELPAPSELTISNEEQAILWQVLSGLPEVYRQPMVLFYRQDESITSVADILGISEEAVRQRLSRGRAMLNERVAKVVESGLRRSGPGKDFGLAVLAALPATGAKAGTAGAVTAAAKTSGLLPAIATMASVVSMAATFAGGFVGLWGRIQNTRSPRDRAFMRRTIWGLLAFTAGFLIVKRLLFTAGVLRLSTRPFDVFACTLFWLAYLGPLFMFSIWRARQRRQIQMREGAPGPWFWNLDPTGRGFKAAVHGSLACLFFGTCCWPMENAFHAHDGSLVAVLVSVCVLGWLVSSSLIAHRPEKTAGIMGAAWWAVAVINLAIVNLRWDAWFAGAPAPQPNYGAPWTVNFFVVLLFASVHAGWSLRRYFLAVPDARRAARIAIGLYLGLLLCAWALLVFTK